MLALGLAVASTMTLAGCGKTTRPAPVAPPTTQTTTETEKSELFSLKLQVRALTAERDRMEDNLNRLFRNQKKLVEAITDLQKKDTELGKTGRENRAYIAMIYKRLLDVEVGMQSLGGGYGQGPSWNQRDGAGPLPSVDNLPGSQTTPLGTSGPAGESSATEEEMVEVEEPLPPPSKAPSKEETPPEARPTP